MPNSYHPLRVAVENVEVRTDVDEPIVRQLFLKSIKFTFVKALILLGRVSVREQDGIMMLVNVVMLPANDGIEPFKELAPI